MLLKQRRCSATLFSHMHKAGFLITRLKFGRLWERVHHYTDIASMMMLHKLLCEIAYFFLSSSGKRPFTNTVSFLNIRKRQNKGCFMGKLFSVFFSFFLILRVLVGWLHPFHVEPRHEKHCFLHMRKQRRDQLLGNRTADQRLCFRYIDSTNYLHVLPKSEIWSL